MRTPPLALLLLGAALPHAPGQESAPQPSATELEITYLANEGFMLAAGDDKVLIDAFVTMPYAGYAALPEKERDHLHRASGPFAGVDLALVTHVHGDHFQPAPACAFTTAAPRCVLAAPEQVLQQLAASCPTVNGASQRKLLPRTGHTQSVDVGGIHVDALRLSHGDGRFASVQNLGYVVTMGGFKILHVGDASLRTATFAPYQLEEIGVDVALVPYWYFDDPAGRALIKGPLRARVTVAMHIPPKGLAKTRASLAEAFPDVIVFDESMQSRRITHATAEPADALAPRTEMIAVNGTELFVKRIGRGNPILVIHGGPVLEHGYLLPHLAPLAKTNELIFYDQRLSGRSAGTVDKSSVRISTFVDDIEALRVALGSGRIHVMAHSWGGLLAMHYALRHGNNLRSLILLDSMSASSKLNQVENERLAELITAEDRAEQDALRGSPAFAKRDPKAIQKMLELSFASQFYDRERLADLELFVPEDYVSRSMQFGAMMVDLRDYDLHDRLSGVSAPTLILYGAAEPGAELGGAALHEAIPHSELVIIDDAGHFPFIEQRDQVLRAVTAFTAKVDG